MSTLLFSLLNSWYPDDLLNYCGALGAGSSVAPLSQKMTMESLLDNRLIAAGGYAPSRANGRTL